MPVCPISKKSKVEQPDIRDLFPVRVLPFQSTPQETIVVLLPRYGDSWLGRLCVKLLGRPYIRMPLEERGSALWLLCDGTNSFDWICQELDARFGEKVAPAKRRGLEYLQQLMSYGAVKLLRKPLDAPIQEPSV